jgi:hypothetical protein
MPPMPPKIALITPVYNRAHLLPATLNSILTQTEPNFELLLHPKSELQKSFSVKARWKTFADKFQAKPIEGTFAVNQLTEEQKGGWISRINNFNKLFGDGGIAAISGFQRSPLRSDYTNDMFERFTVYVREKLDNQKKLWF